MNMLSGLVGPRIITTAPKGRLGGREEMVEDGEMNGDWTHGYNEGYAAATKQADFWIVGFGVLLFVIGLSIGWVM